MKVIKPDYYDLCIEKENIERIRKIGRTYEHSFSIANKEIAHIILSQSEPIKFIATNIEEIPQNQQKVNSSIIVDEKELIIMNDIRNLFFYIAQNREITMWKRLVLMKKYAKLLDKKIEEETYYKKFIKVLYKNVSDERVKKEIESLPSSFTAKYTTLHSLIEIKELTQFLDDNNLLIQEEKFQQKITENNIAFQKIEKRWQIFLFSKQIILEQYIVYYLFSYFIQDIIKNDLKTEVSIIMIFNALINYFIEIKWWMNHEMLSNKEIEIIISNFAKDLEQNLELREKLIDSVTIKDLNLLECCSIFLR